MICDVCKYTGLILSGEVKPHEQRGRNDSKLRMLFESHDAVRWNRASRIYFAWIEMADVWPAGLFFRFFFLLLPVSFAWLPPRAVMSLDSSPATCCFTQTATEHCLNARPCLVCHAPSPPGGNGALQHPSPWVQQPHSLSTFNLLTEQHNLHPSLSLPSFPVSLSAYVYSPGTSKKNCHFRWSDFSKM